MSPADLVTVAIAGILAVAIIAWRGRLRGFLMRLAGSMPWSMAVLAMLPVALRLALLAHFPAPDPAVSDDFSYVLLADTLRHLRLSNPAHPMHAFFETFFVLQEPSYSSIFPIGQGVAIAIGWTLFGHPWAGVLLPIAALSAGCYWMLRGWTTPGWAFVGGVLAAIQFGPLSQWTNSYWGGGVSALAGCLVIGAAVRLRERYSRRVSCLLGLGLFLQMLTRPFESLFLAAGSLLFLGWRKQRIPAVFVVSALAITAVHNRAVTGSWVELPYQSSRHQYGVPAAFVFETSPTPHRELTREQQLNYEAQSAVHGGDGETVESYLARLGFRLRYYRFFFLPPLYLALPFIAPALRERRFQLAVATIALFVLGTNFYPYFYSHYVAAATCLFVLMAVTGLARLTRLNEAAGTFLVAACLAHFVFWYGLHVLSDRAYSAELRQFETWDAINQGDPEGRLAVRRRLTEAPGRQLVFVRYWPRHTFSEWVHNAADIDSSRIVWARDRGPEENRRLIEYYAGRGVWLLEPDARPPRLAPYALDGR